jgi:replicative DNA helicase
MSYDKPDFENLPYSLDVEQAILGAIMLDNGVFNQASELQEYDFFLGSHKTIWNRFIDLHKRGVEIDLVTLSEELRKSEQFDKVGGSTYISSLVDGVPLTINIKPYVDIVLEKSLRRQLARVGEHLRNASNDYDHTPEDLADKAHAALYAVTSRQKKGGLTRVIETAQERVELIEQRIGCDDFITGVPSGLIDLDWLTGGWQKQDLILLAARPSVGKTALALEVAKYAAKRRKKIGFFSMEMSKGQLVDRLLASEAAVSMQSMRTGKISQDDLNNLAEALREMTEMELYIDDTPNLTVTELKGRARRMKDEIGLDLVLADYLGLMAHVGFVQSREQQVSQISRDLKTTAKELDVPFIALSQLSRASENRSDHKPQLSDLRDSGSLEQDCDLCIFIYRESVFARTPENENTAELILAKQRNGPAGEIIPVAFQKEFGRWGNLWREK